MINILSILEKWGLKLTVLLFALGFFIHNVYLMKYDFIEFDILQARYIYTGVMALTYLGLMLTFVLLRLNLDEIRFNFTLLNVCSWLFRFLFLYLILLGLLHPQQYLFQSTLSLYFNDKLVAGFLYLIIAVGSLYVTGIIGISLGMLPSPNARLIQVFKSFLGILSIPFLLSSIVTVSNDKNASAIFFFSLTPFSFVFGYLWGRMEAKEGNRIEPQPIQSQDPELSKQFLRYLNSGLVALLAIIMTISYTNVIYPRVPANLGGARPTPATIIIGLDTLRTKIIYENSDWFIVFAPDSDSTVRLKKESIDKIFMLE